MESLGADLKDTREKQRLTLRQAADATRISLRHLQNLEEARYADLPGGMYNHAFLRSYCEYLGLDPEKMLGRFDQETSHQNEKTSKSKPHLVQPMQDSPSQHLLLWVVLLVLTIGGLFFCRAWIAAIFRPYFTRGTFSRVSEITSNPNMQPPPSVPVPAADPHPADVSASAGAPTVFEPIQTAPKAAPEQASAPTPDLLLSDKIRIQFDIIKKCWVSINSDGNPVLVRLLEPGDMQMFDAQERFYIILGNAGGVRLKINGKAAKPLGSGGEVVRVLINKQNIQDFVATSER